jgi:hypothetical protein
MLPSFRLCLFLLVFVATTQKLKAFQPSYRSSVSRRGTSCCHIRESVSSLLPSLLRSNTELNESRGNSNNVPFSAPAPRLEFELDRAIALYEQAVSLSSLEGEKNKASASYGWMVEQLSGFVQYLVQNSKFKESLKKKIMQALQQEQVSTLLALRGEYRTSSSKDGAVTSSSLSQEELKTVQTQLNQIEVLLNKSSGDDEESQKIIDMATQIVGEALKDGDDPEQFGPIWDIYKRAKMRREQIDITGKQNDVPSFFSPKAPVVGYKPSSATKSTQSSPPSPDKATKASAASSKDRKDTSRMNKVEQTPKSTSSSKDQDSPWDAISRSWESFTTSLTRGFSPGNEKKVEESQPTAKMANNDLKKAADSISQSPIESEKLYKQRSTKVAAAEAAGKQSRWGNAELDRVRPGSYVGSATRESAIPGDSVTSVSRAFVDPTPDGGPKVVSQSLYKEDSSKKKPSTSTLTSLGAGKDSADLYRQREARVQAEAASGKSRWGDMEIKRMETRGIKAPDNFMQTAGESGARGSTFDENLYKQRGARILAGASAGRTRWGQDEIRRAALGDSKSLGSLDRSITSTGRSISQSNSLDPIPPNVPLRFVMDTPHRYQGRNDLEGSGQGSTIQERPNTNIAHTPVPIPPNPPFFTPAAPLPVSFQQGSPSVNDLTSAYASMSKETPEGGTGSLSNSIPLVSNAVPSPTSETKTPRSWSGIAEEYTATSREIAESNDASWDVLPPNTQGPNNLAKYARYKNIAEGWALMSKGADIGPTSIDGKSSHSKSFSSIDGARQNGVDLAKEWAQMNQGTDTTSPTPETKTSQRKDESTSSSLAPQKPTNFRITRVVEDGTTGNSAWKSLDINSRQTSEEEELTASSKDFTGLAREWSAMNKSGGSAPKGTPVAGSASDYGNLEREWSRMNRGSGKDWKD